MSHDPTCLKSMTNHLIIYFTASTKPIPVAIFPESQSKEAIEFLNKCGNFHEIRLAEWNGTGRIPERSETFSY